MSSDDDTIRDPSGPASVPPSLASSTEPEAAARPSSAPRAGVSIPPGPPSPLAALNEACALGGAAALIGSVPSALRTLRAGGSLLGSWLASAAVLIPVLVGLCLLSHAAGRGFRMATGNRAGRSTATGLALWVGLTAPVLALLGAFLKSATHHRGLGGATYGVVGLFVAIGMAVVARRVVVSGRWLVGRGVAPRTVAVGLAVLSVAPLSLVALRLHGSDEGSAQAPLLAATVFDLLIFGLSTAVAVTFDLPARVLERARRVGLPAAAAVFVVGTLWLSMSSHLGAVMRSGGGLAATMMAGLERWTDRDGDGVGAYFGGRDCDEGDPGVHPGADDPLGDGIDQDCDGKDGSGTAASADSATARAAVVSSPTSAPGAVPAPALRTSIVLFTLDSVRADHTSVYGYAQPTTPHLASLAGRGTVFEHAYAAATDTQRGLMPFVSGQRLEQTARDRREWPTVKSEVDTVAERMRDAGYLTAGVSSFTWVSRERGFDQGFDTWTEVFADEHPERGITGPLAVRAARAAIEKTKDDPRPLFLWVHLFDAHEQYKRHDGFDLGKGKVGAYDGEIAFVDAQIKDVLSALDASPRAKSTAIVVVGTQGEGFGEHDSSGHGKELYDETLRVPLVVALPGDSGARRYDAQAVGTVDVAATLVELAGGRADGLSGKSLLPIARGDLAAKREPAFARANGKSAVIDWPMKLIEKRRKGKSRLLLFDLSADPGETKDLSESRAADLSRLEAELRAFEIALGAKD
jgi:arylsulfatase A-like enzyme